MTLVSPSAALGLPPGFPDVVEHVAGFRYLLIVLVALWAWLMARSSRSVAFLAGVLFVEVVLGFWILALQRPYGLIIDAEANRRAAQSAIAATLPGSGDSFLVAQRAAPSGWAWAAGLGMPADVLLWLPTLLPLFVVPLSALAVHVLWRRRDDRALAAALWLAFSTGDWDGTQGFGFVTGLWSHPQSAVVWLIVVAVVLLAGRIPSEPLAFAVGAFAVGSWLLVPAPARSPSLAEIPLWLTLAQGPAIAVAVLGLVRGRDPAALVLTIGGGLLLAASAFGQAEPWGSHAFYRLGLVLAASSEVRIACTAIGLAGLRLFHRLEDNDIAVRFGVAVLLLATVPGSFLAWWDPPRLDAIANESLASVSSSFDRPMSWIRSETASDAAFVASPDYAPLVAALGHRRVLRAPSLATPEDEGRRVRAEGAILAGRPLAAAFRRYAVQYVFLAPGDFRARGIHGPEDLEGRPGFRLRYADEHRFRIYEVVR